VPAAQAAMADAAPAGRAAAGQGLAGATQLAGAALSAFVAAPVYGQWGPEVVFLGAGLVLAVIGVIAVVLHRSGVAAPAVWARTPPETGEIRAQS
jgi:hypothetical protein